MTFVKHSMAVQLSLFRRTFLRVIDWWSNKCLFRGLTLVKLPQYHEFFPLFAGQQKQVLKCRAVPL